MVVAAGRSSWGSAPALPWRLYGAQLLWKLAGHTVDCSGPGAGFGFDIRCYASGAAAVEEEEAVEAW